MKRFLITYTSEFGMQQSYYSDIFDTKDLNTDLQMMVFDLVNHEYLVNSCGWSKIHHTDFQHPNPLFDGGKK